MASGCREVCTRAADVSVHDANREGDEIMKPHTRGSSDCPE